MDATKVLRRRNAKHHSDLLATRCSLQAQLHALWHRQQALLRSEGALRADLQSVGCSASKRLKRDLSESLAQVESELREVTRLMAAVSDDYVKNARQLADCVAYARGLGDAVDTVPVSSP